MRRSFVGVLSLILAVAACGGAGTDAQGDGPLALGIVSGQNQSVVAGAAQLPQPVVGKLVRKSDGSIAFIQTSANRALDLIVPRAFAQSGTVVTGSPVPGAVVCAVSADPMHKLEPFTPCTNTDANGQATFYFTPGTTAGVAKAEIRGSLNNQPAVFDTAKATVSAGAVVNLYQLFNPGLYTVPMTTGTPFDIHTLISGGVDKYNNLIAVDSLPAPKWALLPSDPNIKTSVDLMSDASAAPTDSGWTVTPVAGKGRLYVWFGSEPTAIIRYFITVQ